MRLLLILEEYCYKFGGCWEGTFRIENNIRGFVVDRFCFIIISAARKLAVGYFPGKKDAAKRNYLFFFWTRHMPFGETRNCDAVWPLFVEMIYRQAVIVAQGYLQQNEQLIYPLYKRISIHGDRWIFDDEAVY